MAITCTPGMTHSTLKSARRSCDPTIAAGASSISSPRSSRRAAASRCIRRSEICRTSELRDARNVVLLIIDGLGDNYLHAPRRGRRARAPAPRARSPRCFRRPPRRRSPPRTPAARRSSTASPAGSPTSAKPAASRAALPFRSRGDMLPLARRGVTPRADLRLRLRVRVAAGALDRRDLQGHHRLGVQRAPLPRRAARRLRDARRARRAASRPR